MDLSEINAFIAKLDLRNKLGRWYILSDALMLGTILYLIFEPLEKIRLELFLIVALFYVISRTLYPWEVSRKWKEGNDRMKKK